MFLGQNSRCVQRGGAMSSQGVQLEEECSVPEVPQRWSAATRVAFRFCFVYFGLYCLLNQILTSFVPLPSVEIPDLSTLPPLRNVVLWTGRHILGINTPISYAVTGSGDKTFDWVLLFCMAIVALISTAAWSMLDARRQNYAALYRWFRLFIRLCLAGQMLTYGFAKAIPTQMPFPYLTKLVEPYGNFSPMGVLWASIGASTAYEIFAGCAELLGGVLLIFPRTTTLGALVCLADMIQVFMLNMTYDVPVKQLSFHLMLMSLFLLAPDFQRLIDFFFLNRTALPSTQMSLFPTRRANRIALAAQIFVGLWLIGANAYGGWSIWHQYGGGRPKSELYGIWDVEQQVVDGNVRSALLGDYGRWRRAIFDFRDRMAFQRMDDTFARYATTIDAKGNSLALKDPADKPAGQFTVQRDEPTRLTLVGEMDGHKVRMQLQRVDEKKMLLIKRGFHWVQENPFNR